MVNYNKSKIYCIKSHQTNLVYYGSTTQLLCTRMAKHKDQCKRYLAGTKNYITSYEIIKYEDAYIQLLENYPCDSREELNARERYYIENNDCSNKYIPGRSKKEYRETHREQKQIVSQLYYERMKEIRKIKFDCACCGKYTNASKLKHMATKKHQDYLALNI